MKRLLFLSTLSIMCFYYSVIAQVTDINQPSLRIITLDQDDALLANPSEIALIPGDSLKFVAVNADFDIRIKNAVSFLKIKVVDLKIRINSTTKPESDIYIVRQVDGIDNSYDIYCISNNSWPLAPPRIIIKVQ